MIDFRRMLKNESIEDVILYLAPKNHYSSIDRLYVKYKFNIVGDGHLIHIFGRLLKEGELVENTNSPFSGKGPNWKEPKFVTEKKYGIE